jgi:hypothetical protein
MATCHNNLGFQREKFFRLKSFRSPEKTKEPIKKKGHLVIKYRNMNKMVTIIKVHVHRSEQQASLPCNQELK